MKTKPFGRWSAVVALIGSTAACGGIYDMGSGSAGSGGEGGGDVGAGGSGVISEPPTGNAGSPDPGTGGSAASSSGTGGSGPAGGSSGAGCPSAWDGMPEGPLAAPELIGDRVMTLISGAPPSSPFELDRSNVREQVRLMMQSFSTTVAPPGLSDFVQGWAFDGVDDAEEPATHWASEFFMHAGSFAKLFAPFGDTSDRRASFLSEPALLRAYPSIATRGVFTLERAFCLDVGTPPEGSPTVQAGPGQTTRQAFEASGIGEPACLGCHSYIDPLGFAFEHFDAVGAYRASENSQPIDASGSFFDSRSSVEFVDVVELAAWMGESPDVASCLARWFFRYAREGVVGRSSLELSNPEAEAVACEFVARGYEPLSLLEAVVDTPSFLLE
jgi:hypothetical protein